MERSQMRHGQFGYMGTARDLTTKGVELPALLTAGRCRKSCNE